MILPQLEGGVTSDNDGEKTNTSLQNNFHCKYKPFQEEDEDK